jgi:hypothetical protein
MVFGFEEYFLVFEKTFTGMIGNMARHGAQIKRDNPVSKQRQALLLWGVDWDDIKRGLDWCDRTINEHAPKQ